MIDPARRYLVAILVLGLVFANSKLAFAETPTSSNNHDDIFDVVVYGGTSAGIAASVQVKRMGGSVIVLEPTSRIGGLTTGGLGQTDIGNKRAIGGISREFYRLVRTYYDDPNHWKWQDPEDYRSHGQSLTSANEDTMWTFEPSVALAIMEGLIKQYRIPVVYQARLDRSPVAAEGTRVTGVSLEGTRIVSIATEAGKTYRGRVFIDATYEGDLMAGAGVSYTVGRESNAQYGETLNGVQTGNAVHHQFMPGVDPYVIPGQVESGLLPGIDPTGPGDEGAGDSRVQTYCFRMCLTDVPENRIPFFKPADYDPLDYELLFRNFAAGAKIIPWSKSDMPNRKTDVNNNRGFSTDFIGQNYAYPDASYAEREQIVQRHRSYQQGLMWTLANHPRVPEKIRQEVARWGTCRDEFDRRDGWQQQLYIREARRMVGEVVMTQHHCVGQVVAERPIGLAAYTMDSHNVQRYVNTNGYVQNEGDVQVGGFSPYPIEYGSIVPKRDECSNLLVPVCMSASHIAFGSIRMEPVFMVLGQSAATAAMQSIKAQSGVQDIEYDRLQARLLQDKQILAWTGPKRTPAPRIELASVEGIVVDDVAIERVGFDHISSSIGPFIAAGYRHDSNQAKGDQSAIFRVQIPRAGRYTVRLSWTPNPNRATNIPVTVHHTQGETTVSLNQQNKPDRGAFGTIGVYTFPRGEATVTVSNKGTDGYVIVDALQVIAAE